MQKIAIPLQTEDEELIPTYSTEGASGADIRANIKEPLCLEPGCTATLPTGIRVAIPLGYEIQIRPRSGLAAKHAVTVLNTPGTIDADYRGEICVILINHGREPFLVVPKMRIAQMVLSPVMRADFAQVEELTVSQRGEGRFGHTGA